MGVAIESSGDDRSQVVVCVKWKIGLFIGSLAIALLPTCPKRYANGRTVLALLALSPTTFATRSLAEAPRALRHAGRA